MSDGLAYFDASAFVKLFWREPESEALLALLGNDWSLIGSSEILAVEASRAARRVGGGAPARAARLLATLTLVPLSPALRSQACLLGPPELRSLDAIHLATALSVRDRVGAVFTYDKRLAEASAEAGLQVLAPA
ncbi:MAG TPA: type II toxin-antitoxin system VapC family toxin [Solirubrobacterales bacterium]|nr:type II toxin-antitoxin system VapC family toxin [Solirubrobacterales bacterium]